MSRDGMSLHYITPGVVASIADRILVVLKRYDLLIIDYFGLKVLNNNERMALMEIIEDRHDKKSTIIASQLPVRK